jgi:hypothetical protein
MGSLYVGAANAPPATGDLIKIQVDSNCNISISGNAIRGDVVLEDVTSLDVNAPGCEVNDMDCDPVTGQAKWIELGKPEAWCCPGQREGDASGDGKVNIFDLIPLKASYGITWPAAGYDCRCDSTHDGKVNIFDLIKLKSNYGTTVDAACSTYGYDPSDCGP